MRMREHQVFFAAALAVGSWAASPAGAAPIVLLDEHFNDGGLTNGADTADTAWYAINGSTGGTAWAIATDNTSPLSGNVMRQNGSTMANTTMAGDFPGGTAVLGVGDSILVTFDVRSATDATNGALIVTLAHNNGTAMSGNELGDPNSNTFQHEDDKLVTLFSVNNNGSPFDDTSPHSVSVQLTRTASGFDREVKIDGTQNTSLSTAITSPATTDFNHIRFFWNGENASKETVSGRVDNIVVTVPEPSAAVGAAVVAGSLLLRRQRGGR